MRDRSHARASATRITQYAGNGARRCVRRYLLFLWRICKWDYWLCAAGRIHGRNTISCNRKIRLSPEDTNAFRSLRHARVSLYVLRAIRALWIILQVCNDRSVACGSLSPRSVWKSLPKVLFFAKRCPTKDSALQRISLRISFLRENPREHACVYLIDSTKNLGIDVDINEALRCLLRDKLRLREFEFSRVIRKIRTCCYSGNYFSNGFSNCE